MNADEATDGNDVDVGENEANAALVGGHTATGSRRAASSRVEAE